ncbi:MAG: outer membrane beta-barrel protein [Lewinellaceae bacterium]|nr:outer membrane beta-barrel protein [Saprospiraceae bacterium]MCB9341035.1 outer membrane beta-barrel protein [Lewinellaceae bacterium]
MKNPAITLLFVAGMFQAALAQTSKGDVLLGSTVALGGGLNALIINPSNSGGLNYSTLKTKSDNPNADEQKETGVTISVSPSFGRFLADGLVGGVGLNLLYQSTKPDGSSQNVTQTILLAGPFIRYYLPLAKVKPFFEVNPAFGTSRAKFGSFDNKTSLVKLGGGAGVAIFLGENVSFDALLHYERFTSKDKDNNPNNERQIIGTFGVNVGFTFFL